MEILLTLLVILAATVGLGWLIKRWERKHPVELTQTQIDNLNDMAKRMRQHRKASYDDQSDQ